MTTPLERLYGDILGALVESPGTLMGDRDCKLCGRPTVRGRHLGVHALDCAIASKLAKSREGATGIAHEAVIEALATDEMRQQWARGAEIEAVNETLSREVATHAV